MTSYEADLARISREIDDIARGTAPDLSPGAEQETRLLYRRFQQASLTGKLSALGSLGADIDAQLGSSRSSKHADLWLLKAYIAVKLHQFAEAESFLRGDETLAMSAPALLVQADVDLQFGRYDSVRSRIDAALAQDRSWDGLARLAYLNQTMGDFDAADALYAEAEDELTAKQMHSFAWLQLQRGAMWFGRGGYERAAMHYARAERAYSGYWLVEERVAELAGAQGRFGVAIAGYERLYAETQRPEWEHALGELHSLAGEAETAHTWKTKALDHYRASLGRGEVHYLHLLVDLCCEMPGLAGEAVAWARRDVDLRSNPMTQGDLAWALYRNRESGEALEWIERALAFKIVSARLYLQAACIFAGAGRGEMSAKYMRLSRAVNPAPAKARAIPVMRVPAAV